MAGHCLPAEPRFHTRTEELVWRALRSRLRECDVLLHGVRLVGRDGDWEADLVLLMPEGFATVEVKGGQVRFEGGEYVQLTPDGRKVIDLAEQAVSEKYLVRRHIAKHPRWKGGPPRMAHFVALPDTSLAADADMGPGLPRWMVFAKGEEKDAAGRIYDVLCGKLDAQPKAGPGVDGVELAAEILGGRGDSQVEVAAIRVLRDDVVRRLTDEQHRILDLTRMLPRYQVVGGPGTGKTYLAMEQAQRWAAAGLRVAFVAYSRGLTSWVQRVVDGWPEDVGRRVTVTTFHALGHRWGAVAPDAATQTDWDQAIPTRMSELVDALPAEERFDAIVVDEGQDFGALWWRALLASYADPAVGRLAVFSDAAQQVFGREGADDLGLPVLPLDENLRNSGPIAESVNTLLPTSLAVKGGHGPAVRFVACSAGEAISVADEQAEALIDEGWAQQDIALLTTQHRHPVQTEMVANRGREGYWDAFWDASQFFYSTVPGFKGLERPAVVLAVDGFREPETARETLVVGMSRARDLLVVCGDPVMLRQVGGKAFAKRLAQA
jgi:hypothetical protein